MSSTLGGYPAVADRDPDEAEKLDEPDELPEEEAEVVSVDEDDAVDGVVHTESRAPASFDVE